MLWPFYACSTIFCFCLLSFPHHFCYSRLVFFRSATCFVLFLHAFLAAFVVSCISFGFSFLQFGFSFLHAIPATNTSCCSLFFFIMLLHINFHTYPFIQKNLGLCEPDNVDWIKRVLGPICLDLSKPFCWRIVFCGRFVFCYRFVIWCRSAFCCRSLSLALLSLDLSCSSIFLVGFWALLFIGLSSSRAFG